MNMILDNEKKKNISNVWHQYFDRKYIFLIPNILCYFRILLVVCFMVFYLIPITMFRNTLAHIYIAAGIMMIAAYSDFIDGYIARTFDMKSDLGIILDPLADKILQLAIAVIIVINYYSTPIVLVMFGVFLAKEITLFFEDLLLASRRNTSYGGAKWYGKLSSFVFYVVTIFILLGVPILKAHDPEGSASYVSLVINICCSVATACLVLAWILYFVLFVKIMRKPPVEKKEEETKND